MKKISVSEYRALAKKPKRSKYRAVRTKVDGISFHSKGEAKRWQELKLLEQARQICGLKRQVKFALCSPSVGEWAVVGHYQPDFTYMERGKLIAEDFKGFMNPLSKWKIRHFSLQYKEIEVRITGAANR